MLDSTFRTRGKKLGNLAKEFLDNDIEPDEAYRPIDEDPQPLDEMIEEAAKLLYNTSIYL